MSRPSWSALDWSMGTSVDFSRTAHGIYFLHPRRDGLLAASFVSKTSGIVQLGAHAPGAAEAACQQHHDTHCGLCLDKASPLLQTDHGDFVCADCAGREL